ncbi:hypothetical protein D3C80_542380 [compost metagenome]
MIKRLILILLLITSIKITVSAQSWDGVKLQNGDLLFEDLDCGPLCDAIEEVTQSYGGHRFSHIGLVYLKADSAYIIEAIGAKVQLTPIDKFTGRTSHKIYVGRVRKAYKKIANEAVAFSLSKLNVPYDDEFIYDNGKYYCSELIYDAFMNANKDKPFFKLEPMTFKQPGTAEFYPAWVAYYKELSVDIPEAKPGINPGGISRSEKIEICNP